MGSEAGPVTEDVPQRGLTGGLRVLHLEIGKQLLDRHIEADLALFDQHRNRHAGESLGRRTDRKAGFGIDLGVAAAIAIAVSACKAELAVLDDGDGDAGVPNRLMRLNGVLDEFGELRSKIRAMNFHGPLRLNARCFNNYRKLQASPVTA